MRWTTSSAVASSTPASLRAARQMGMTEPGTERDDQFQGAGDAEDDADPAAVIVALRAVAGILEGLSGGHQPEQLRGVDRLQGVGGDVELHRIEGDRGEKAAALAVGHVRGFRILVEVVCNAPVGCRDLGDGIDPFADIGPVGRSVVGLGKEAADADDGQRNPAGGDGLVHVFLFHRKVLLDLCVFKRFDMQCILPGGRPPGSGGCWRG